MRTAICTLLFILLVQANLKSQPLPTQWQRCYGGASHDEAAMVIPAINGGFISIGWSSSADGDHTAPTNGGADYWVVRTDDYGNIIWENSYGGSGSEYATSIVSTGNGYILAGYTYSSDGEVTGLHGAPYPHSFSDYWVVAIDTAGNLLWQKTYGGTSIDNANTILKCKSGGYLVTGITISDDGDVTNYHGIGDAWLVKIDDTGAIVWQKAYGGANSDDAFTAVQTMDGGYVFGGRTSSDSVNNNNKFDYWVVKLDDTGGITWQKYFGGAGVEGIESMIQTKDSGYIVAGYTTSTNGDVPGNHGGEDYWILKLDQAGNKLWSKTYGGSADDEALSITQTLDGGYMVAGSSYSSDGDVTGNHGNQDIWLLKLSDTGVIQWQKSFGGSNNEFPGSILQTPDSGYLVAGTTASSNGGEITGSHGQEDYWFFRLDKFAELVPTVNKNSIINVYPNPAQNTLAINSSAPITSLTISNVLGQTVYTAHCSAQQFTVDLRDWAPGIYFARINDTVVRKFVKQ